MGITASMPRGKKHKGPVSKAQARLFGAVAGGRKTKATGLSKSEAKGKLRGRKIKGLPPRKP
jgi:hypothetical protein